MIINDCGIWIDGFQIWDVSPLDANYNASYLSITAKKSKPAYSNTTIINNQSLGATDDTTLTDVIPVGYVLKYVVVNNPGALPAQISAGTTSGANDIFSAEAVKESGMTVIKVFKAFSFSNASSVYFNH